MNAFTFTRLSKLEPTVAFLLQSFPHKEHWAGCSTQEKDDVTEKTELIVNIFT